MGIGQTSPLGIAGAFVLLVGLVVVGRKVWQYVRAIAVGLRKVGHVLDDVLGEKGRHGEPDRPGWGERLAAIEDRLGSVEHELHPNSGESMRDAVDRLETAFATETPDRYRASLRHGRKGTRHGHDA